MGMENDLFGDSVDDITGWLTGHDNSDTQEFDWDNAIGPGTISGPDTDGFGNNPPAARIPTASSLPQSILESRPIPPRKRTGYANAGKVREPRPGPDPDTSKRMGSIARQALARAGGINDLRAAVELVSRERKQRSVGSESSGGSSIEGDTKPANPSPGRPKNLTANGQRVRRTGTGLAAGVIRQIAPEYSAPEFQPANFTCYVKDIKFPIGGEAILQLAIPYEMRNEAVKFVETRGLTIVVSARRIDYENE